MKTVYVIAWKYESGAGFDWYVDKAAADAAFSEEQLNEKALAAENYHAYRFEYTPKATEPEAITDEIDENFPELEEQYSAV